MSISFSPLAISDLQAISDHIALDSPTNAADFVNQLLDRCLDIDLAPEGYIARPEIGDNIRSVAFKHYMIFYSNIEGDVRVERILHSSRDYLGGDVL